MIASFNCRHLLGLSFLPMQFRASNSRGIAVDTEAANPIAYRADGLAELPGRTPRKDVP